MKFKVTIRKEGDKDYKKIIEAGSRLGVYNQVQEDGGSVVDIVEIGRLKYIWSFVNISINTGVRRADIIMFAKNLSAMLKAGLSLSRALTVIERQSGNKQFTSVVRGVSESIQNGSSFHAAIAKYPRVFPSLLVAMARAGEESGSLTESLRVISVQLEHGEELVRKVRSALLYPAIILIAIMVISVLMLMYVVPVLTDTFKELGVQVPFATRAIVAISNFLVSNSNLVIVTLATLFISGSYFVRSKIGRAFVLWGVLRLPVVGEIIRETYSARTMRTLSSLLASGVPVLEALSVTKDVVHDDVFARVIAEAEKRVNKGEPMSDVFIENSHLYPIMVGDMLLVGEETGDMSGMLQQTAEFYEESVSYKTRDMSTIIEPVVMLVVGAVVGIFAVAMIAPIYSLSASF